MSLRIKSQVKKLKRSLSWSSLRRGDLASSPRDHSDPFAGGGSNVQDLPEGWESALDSFGKEFFINHTNGTTTYEDPRQSDVKYEYAEERTVTVHREELVGFGFVAGSERPVVVRFITEDGPSDGKLLPGDQLLYINGTPVKDAPRSEVIRLVRGCTDEITVTVSQPPMISTLGKKSILLNAARKQLKAKHASRVHFPDEELKGLAKVNDSPSPPSVLRVHLENNQVRAFKYDSNTKVKEVLGVLQERFNVSGIAHFSLVLHDGKSPQSSKMRVLSAGDRLAEVLPMYAEPEEDFRCLFRLVYIPRDPYDLLRSDSVAFEYFYTQCCNDVIQERFSSDLKCDSCLRLASLHMYEHTLSQGIPGHKITVKNIERDFGFERFVNPSMLRAFPPKLLRKNLTRLLKMNQSLVAPGQREVTTLQARLHYLKIVCELRTFGGKCFLATLLDEKTEAMLLVGPRSGISRVTDIKLFTLQMMADYDLIEKVIVTDQPDGASQEINISLIDPKLSKISLAMLREDGREFVAYVEGYHSLYVCPTEPLVLRATSVESDTPPQGSGLTSVSGDSPGDGNRINGLSPLSNALKKPVLRSPVVGRARALLKAGASNDEMVELSSGEEQEEVRKNVSAIINNNSTDEMDDAFASAFSELDGYLGPLKGSADTTETDSLSLSQSGGDSVPFDRGDSVSLDSSVSDSFTRMAQWAHEGDKTGFGAVGHISNDTISGNSYNVENNGDYSKNPRAGDDNVCDETGFNNGAKPTRRGVHLNVSGDSTEQRDGDIDDDMSSPGRSSLSPDGLLSGPYARSSIPRSPMIKNETVEKNNGACALTISLESPEEFTPSTSIDDILLDSPDDDGASSRGPSECLSSSHVSDDFPPTLGKPAWEMESGIESDEDSGNGTFSSENLTAAPPEQERSSGNTEMNTTVPCRPLLSTKAECTSASKIADPSETNMVASAAHQETRSLSATAAIGESLPNQPFYETKVKSCDPLPPPRRRKHKGFLGRITGSSRKSSPPDVGFRLPLSPSRDVSEPMYVSSTASPEILHGAKPVSAAADDELDAGVSKRRGSRGEVSGPVYLSSTASPDVLKNARPISVHAGVDATVSAAPLAILTSREPEGNVCQVSVDTPDNSVISKVSPPSSFQQERDVEKVVSAVINVGDDANDQIEALPSPIVDMKTGSKGEDQIDGGEPSPPACVAVSLSPRDEDQNEQAIPTVSPTTVSLLKEDSGHQESAMSSSTGRSSGAMALRLSSRSNSLSVDTERSRHSPLAIKNRKLLQGRLSLPVVTAAIGMGSVDDLLLGKLCQTTEEDEDSGGAKKKRHQYRSLQLRANTGLRPSLPPPPPPRITSAYTIDGVPLERDIVEGESIDGDAHKQMSDNTILSADDAVKISRIPSPYTAEPQHPPQWLPSPDSEPERNAMEFPRPFVAMARSKNNDVQRIDSHPSGENVSDTHLPSLPFPSLPDSRIEGDMDTDSTTTASAASSPRRFKITVTKKNLDSATSSPSISSTVLSSPSGGSMGSFSASEEHTYDRDSLSEALELIACRGEQLGENNASEEKRGVTESLTHESPAHESPAHESLTHESLAHESPAHESPPHESSAHDESSKDMEESGTCQSTPELKTRPPIAPKPKLKKSKPPPVSRRYKLTVLGVSGHSPDESPAHLPSSSSSSSNSDSSSVRSSLPCSPSVSLKSTGKSYDDREEIIGEDCPVSAGESPVGVIEPMFASEETILSVEVIQDTRVSAAPGQEITDYGHTEIDDRQESENITQEDGEIQTNAIEQAKPVDNDDSQPHENESESPEDLGSSSVANMSLEDSTNGEDVQSNVEEADVEETDDTCIESNGNFIKFSGYKGHAAPPPVSPKAPKIGRFRKKSSKKQQQQQQRYSMEGLGSVGEAAPKRGVLSRILHSLRPKHRSLSLSRLFGSGGDEDNGDTTPGSERRKLQTGSLKMFSKKERASVLPSGDPHEDEGSNRKTDGFKDSPVVSRSWSFHIGRLRRTRSLDKNMQLNHLVDSEKVVGVAMRPSSGEYASASQGVAKEAEATVPSLDLADIKVKTAGVFSKRGNSGAASRITAARGKKSIRTGPVVLDDLALMTDTSQVRPSLKAVSTPNLAESSLFFSIYNSDDDDDDEDGDDDASSSTSRSLNDTDNGDTVRDIETSHGSEDNLTPAVSNIENLRDGDIKVNVRVGHVIESDSEDEVCENDAVYDNLADDGDLEAPDDSKLLENDKVSDVMEDCSSNNASQSESDNGNGSNERDENEDEVVACTPRSGMSLKDISVHISDSSPDVTAETLEDTEGERDRNHSINEDQDDSSVDAGSNHSGSLTKGDSQFINRITEHDSVLVSNSPNTFQTVSSKSLFGEKFDRVVAEALAENFENDTAPNQTQNEELSKDLSSTDAFAVSLQYSTQLQDCLSGIADEWSLPPSTLSTDTDSTSSGSSAGISSTTPQREFRRRQKSLIYEVRQFVIDSKSLVSAVAHAESPKDMPVQQCVSACAQTLARAAARCRDTSAVLDTRSSAAEASGVLQAVAEEYSNTLQRCQLAAGTEPTGSPMRELMAAASRLAAALTTALKTLSSLELDRVAV